MKKLRKRMAVDVDFFIGYDGEDLKIVRHLYVDLKQDGVSLWLDAENLLLRQKWHIIFLLLYDNELHPITLLCWIRSMFTLKI